MYANSKIVQPRHDHNNGKVKFWKYQEASISNFNEVPLMIKQQVAIKYKLTSKH